MRQLKSERRVRRLIDRTTETSRGGERESEREK